MPQFNEKKFKATKNLGKNKMSSKLMGYNERAGQFDGMLKKIKQGL